MEPRLMSAYLCGLFVPLHKSWAGNQIQDSVETSNPIDLMNMVVSCMKMVFKKPDVLSLFSVRTVNKGHCLENKGLTF